MENKTFLKHSIRVVSVMAFIGACFPMLKANMGIGIMWPSFVMLIVLNLFNRPDFFFSSPFLWPFIYMLQILYYAFYQMNIDLYNTLMVLALPITLSLIYIEYFLKKNDNEGIKILLYASILIIIIKCITGIAIESIHPDAARNITGGEMNYNSALNLNKSGVASYTFINSLPFLFIPFVYCYKKSKTKYLKIFLISLIFLALLTIIKTGWGTALILSIIAIVGGFMIINTKKPWVVIFSILVATVLIFLLLPKILNLASNIFADNPTLLAKVKDIQESLIEGEQTGQIQQRGDLYQRSIDTFLENPYFGDYKGSIGGHAFWLDSLALRGVIGTFPLVMAIISLYRLTLRYLPKDYKYMSLINLVLFFSFGSVKGMGGFEFFLFPFVVGSFLIYFFSYKIIRYKRNFNKRINSQRYQPTSNYHKYNTFFPSKPEKLI